MPTRILIAEDEPHIVESLSFLLRREGFEVSAVDDGEKAMQRISVRLPDVLVLDVMLPRLNGFDVLRRLRANPAQRKLPVVMLTAKGQVQDRETAEAIGANAFITKPFSNKDVVAQIRALVLA